MAESRSGDRRADVVVVGAGFAGLAAARTLVAAGRRVLVLEARDRVGGRVCSRELADGSVVDLGGQWIGPTQDRIAALAKEMGVDTFPTHIQGDMVFEVEGATYRDLSQLDPAGIKDFLEAQARLDELAREVPVERPWDAPHARDWDAQTAEAWICENCQTSLGRAVLRIALGAIFATEPSNFSLLHALFTLHTGGSFDRVTGTQGGAQQDIFTSGAQLVAVRMAERLDDAVLLEAPVRRIEHSARGVRIESDRLRVAAEHAIVATPPLLAGRVVYDPPLPGYRDQLTQRVPHGTVTKFQVAYDRPFWREQGLNGSAASDAGPVGFTFDGTRPSADNGVLVAFLEGEPARQLGRKSAAVRRAAVLECLVRFFGPEAGRPREFHELDWSEEEWTRGCYGAHLPPGAWTQYGPALREPVGRIHWAGSETARVWAGYMDGAVESGERAAAEVLAAGS